MSVRNRIEDAQILRANGRFDGALLSVLVGIAATSRKRRPRPVRDRASFETFLGEEMLVVTHGGVLNYNVKYRDELVPMQELLYRFVRNELAHEGKLPGDVHFEKPTSAGSLSVNVQTDRIVFSDTWFDGFCRCVQYAPENRDEFPEVGKMPDDVKKWFMFGERRLGELVAEYWERRKQFGVGDREDEATGDQPTRDPQSQKQDRLTEIKAQHPMAYEPWTAADDERLVSMAEEGVTVEEISERLERQPSAIRSRLAKLDDKPT